MTEKTNEHFVRLMTRHQRQIWWFISTLLPAASDADDVLQETSLVLWRKWDQFDIERDFLPWACGIARLQALRYVRERRSQRRHLDDVVLGEIAEMAQRRVQDLARVETRLNSLRACVEVLSVRERKVVESRYFRSWTAKQIAEDLGMPLVTVYKTLERARVQLMHCVNRKIADGEIG